MIHQLPPDFDSLPGLPCCRLCMGNGRALSAGFGRLIPSKNPSRADDPDPEWWLGTYYGTWRIMKDGAILCGAFDAVDDRPWLRDTISAIKPGAFISLTQTSSFDLRLTFSNDIAIDFMWTSSEVDNLFMVFGPGDLYFAFSSNYGWRQESRYGPSGAHNGY